MECERCMIVDTALRAVNFLHLHSECVPDHSSSNHASSLPPSAAGHCGLH